MTLSKTVSRVEIKRDSRQKQMKQFFDEEVLGLGTERNKRGGKGGDRGRGAGYGRESERARFSGEGERVAISTYFHGSDFPGPGKRGDNGISGFHVPRQLH